MRRINCALGILTLVLIAGTAFGQAQRGSITVKVVAEDGSVLPGATVTAESDQTLTRRVSITNAQGRATLAGLDPAPNYVVTVTLDGFNGAREKGVQVRAGQNTPLQVTLSLAIIREELVEPSRPGALTALAPSPARKSPFTLRCRCRPRATFRPICRRFRR